MSHGYFNSNSPTNYRKAYQQSLMDPCTDRSAAHLPLAFRAFTPDSVTSQLRNRLLPVALLRVKLTELRIRES